MLNKNKRPFGLDISDISLKLAQFGLRGEIIAYSDAPIAKDVMSGDMIKDPRHLIEIIAKAVAAPKFGHITSPYVIASIPETKSFVRVIQMQRLSEEEAREAVPFEAEQYIPMPVGAVYLDWVILGSSDVIASQQTKQSQGSEIAAAPSTSSGPRNDDNSKMTVLITAAPRDYVDDYVRVLKEAGLKPLALEVESQATARSLVSGDYTKESILIADIDTVRTSLIIYDRGVLQFTSSLPIAGNALTEAISKALTIDMAAAEKMKRETGLEDNAEVRKALLPVLNNLLDEIKNTIHFHEEHNGTKISRLLLAGGSSKLRHLPSFFQEKLSDTAVKVELGNPWNKILKPSETPPLSREDSLSYATAIGLALRELE